MIVYTVIRLVRKSTQLKDDVCWIVPKSQRFTAEREDRETQ